jgi:hypothetical protein
MFLKAIQTTRGSTLINIFNPPSHVTLFLHHTFFFNFRNKHKRININKFNYQKHFTSISSFARMECDAPKEKRINSGMQDAHYYEELRNWLSKNEVAKLPESDEILRYSDKEHREVLGASPWTKDPHYFNLVKVSAVALLKMLIHAHSGGNIEVRFLSNM